MAAFQYRLLDFKARCVAATIAQAAILITSPAFGQPYPYRLTDLGTLSANQSGPWAVNNSGHVVGYVTGGITGSQSYYYDGDTTIAIGTAGSFNNHANDINDAGIIVGAYGLISRAFVYDTGVISYVGTLPGGTTSAAFGVNEAGHVVGSASIGSEDHAFYYDSMTMLDLGTFGGTTSRAYDINESDQIVGYALNADVRRRAFIYEGGVMTDLGALGGESSTAYAINDLGHVVDWADLPPGGAPVARSHAFVHDGETMRDLGTFGGVHEPGDRHKQCG